MALAFLLAFLFAFLLAFLLAFLVPRLACLAPRALVHTNPRTHPIVISGTDAAYDHACDGPPSSFASSSP